MDAAAEDDELRALARLVRDMRRSQARYFRDRSAENLTAAKLYERRVDAAVTEILDLTTPSLPFGRPAAGASS